MNIEAIHERNARVEADKAWETSWTRKIIITLGTYTIVSGYLMLLGMERACLHALVPAGSYFVSTLSLPIFKKLWVEKVYKKEASL